MKKTAIASAMIIATGFAATSAHAQDSATKLLDNWEERSYAQAKLGFADLGLNDDAMTLTGTYGLKMAHVHPQLSVEADVFFTLADAESEVSSSFGTTKAEASTFGFAGYLVGTYDQLSIEKLKPYVRVGLGYTSADVEVSNSMASASGDDSEFGLAYGIGARYDFTDNLGVLVEYNETEFDFMNVGVHYGF